MSERGPRFANPSYSIPTDGNRKPPRFLDGRQEEDEGNCEPISAPIFNRLSSLALQGGDAPLGLGKIGRDLQRQSVGGKRLSVVPSLGESAPEPHITFGARL